MFAKTRRSHRLLAAAAGTTLTLALAVSAGALPHPGAEDLGPARSVASASTVEEIAAPARQAGDIAEATQAAEVATTVAPTTVPPTTAAPQPRTTTPPTTRAARPTTTSPAATSTAPPVATPAAPAAPAKVARRTPSPAEVQAAINELKRQVGGLLMLVSPTPAQIDQVGDQVCTAFDNGQSFAQVRTTGLSMIPASITVSPSTADWAVRRAVALYCPGHANKLV